MLSTTNISNTNNTLLIADTKKEKKPPTFEGKKRQTRKTKLQGTPTEAQEWRIFKNFTEPASILKNEMEQEEDETVKKLKELMGIKPDPENFSDVITQGTENVILRNSIFNQEQKTLNDEIDKANYIKQQEEEATRNILQKLGDARRKKEKEKLLAKQNSAVSKLQTVIRARKENKFYNEFKLNIDNELFNNATNASTKIQGAVRNRNAKKELSKLRQDKLENGASTMIQQTLTNHNARKELSKLRQDKSENDASTKIQRAVKARTARNELSKLKTEKDASTKIQQAIRGKIARKALFKADLDNAIRNDPEIKRERMLFAAESRIKKAKEERVRNAKPIIMGSTPPISVYPKIKIPKTKKDGTMDARYSNKVGTIKTPKTPRQTSLASRLSNASTIKKTSRKKKQ